MLRWVAIVLFIAGIVVALYGRATAQGRWVVTGVAATIAGALTLAVLPDERGVWPKVKDEVAAARTGQYDFTADWFDLHIENWTRDLAHIAGRPGVRFLEIGSHEGRAAVWLLRNVLTHNTARIDCVDVFDEPAYTTRFDHNVKVASAEGKVNKIVGPSQEVLRQLRIEHYDAIYVDGSHTACDVLEDSVLAFRLLKHGGVMIFDDYQWALQPDPLLTPKPAIDAFLTIYQGQYELLHHDYQVSIKRL